LTRDPFTRLLNDCPAPAAAVEGPVPPAELAAAPPVPPFLWPCKWKPTAGSVDDADLEIASGDMEVVMCKYRIVDLAASGPLPWGNGVGARKIQNAGSVPTQQWLARRSTVARAPFNSGSRAVQMR